MQTEIKTPKFTNPKYKTDFLKWLDRFSRVSPSFRNTIEHFHFTEAELNALRPQVEIRYRLKKSYIDAIHKGG